jgi:serine protease Do
MMLKSLRWIIAIVLIAAPASLAQDNGINLRHTVVVDVVQKTKGAVVNISAARIVQRRVVGNPFFQEYGRVYDQPITSLGSGFIIQADGYVVTNNHVVDRARAIQVELADGRKLRAELIGADPDADLAVLRIHSAGPLPTIELGESSDLMIGEPAIAVGDPFGYSHSVSTGIVSALHRNLQDIEHRESLSDLIQTDAAINPGNSGGPLLNAYGQVIGINTAIRGDAQNIGFAIPIDRLRDLIPQLMNPAGSAKVEVPVKLTEQRTITPPATISVRVMDGDEVVRSIDGKPVHNLIEAYALMLQTQPGETVEIVTDHGKRSLLAQRATSAFNPIASAHEKLGIDVQALTPEIADQLGVPADSGVLIAQVLAGSPAAMAAAQAGDVIFLLGTAPVHGMESFGVALRHLPESGRVRVGIIRRNQLEYGYLRL